MTPLKGIGYVAITALIFYAAFLLIEKGQRDAEEDQREADQAVVEDVERVVRDVIEDRGALEPSNRDCDAVRILREAAKVSDQAGTIALPDDLECGDLFLNATVDE